VDTDTFSRLAISFIVGSLFSMHTSISIYNVHKLIPKQCALRVQTIEQFRNQQRTNCFTATNDKADEAQHIHDTSEQK
jgi:hypothetical protein